MFVGILTLVVVLTIARCEKKRLDRLLKTTKVDVGDSDEDEAEKISKIVGLSAVKYGDLSNQASKDYIFDVDRFTS